MRMQMQTVQERRHDEVNFLSKKREDDVSNALPVLCFKQAKLSEIIITWKTRRHLEIEVEVSRIHE